MSEEVSDSYYVRRREFLNEDPELPAFIIGIVQDTREIPDDDPERWNRGDIVLDLADCERRVSFYFNMCNESARANSWRKITLIAEVVNAVREAIALEVASRNARAAKIKSVTAEADARNAKTCGANALAVVDVEPVKTEEARREQVFTSNFITLGL
jgi:hypothetical protein